MKTPLHPEQLRALEALKPKLESEGLRAMAGSRSSKTPDDFAATGVPITAWAFYEVFERKHCGTGWLRAQMGRMEHDLATAHASLREMIVLNETTGDPDPEITDRARAILPENTESSNADENQ